MIKKEKYIINIPQELKERSQWLWFKIYHNKDKNGNSKIIKIPISPITFESNEWNKRENWADFATALACLEKSGCDGLSFILSEDDPFVCIDLDNVEENVLKMFQVDFRHTYKEISQSGKGVHIFVRGQIEKNFNNQIEKVEMYQENRCIAMTGILSNLGTQVCRKFKMNLINIISYLHPKIALEKRF